MPEGKKKFIGYFIEQKVIENDNFVAAIMDKCVMSAIDDNTNLEIIDQKKIIAESNAYIAEYKEYLEKNREEGFNMIEDTKVREDVNAAIRKCMASKMDKAKSLNKLRKDFKLPAAELSNLWIEVKKEDGIMYCPDPPEEIKEENKPITEEKEVRQAIHLKEEKAIEKATGSKKEGSKNIFEVVKKIIELRTQNGTYEKTLDGVKFENKIYKNQKEVDEEKGAIKNKLIPRKSEIENQIERLNKELSTINKTLAMTDIRAEEIKAAFVYEG